MKKIILIGLLTAASNLFAQSVATVLFTKNKVMVSHNGAQKSLSRGSSLNVGDAIITSSDAVANIKYSNGTLVNLGANSNYKILAFSPKHSAVQIKAELNSGSLSSTTTGKMKETLKTPVIALAILGTEYAAAVVNSKKTNVEVTSGHVEMRNKIYGPGTSVAITPEGIYTAPAFPVPPAAPASTLVTKETSAAAAASTVSFVVSAQDASTSTSSVISTSSGSGYADISIISAGGG